MENLRLGLEIMVIGFAVVMATLYLLYLILLGFSRCCARPAKPEPRKETVPTPPSSVLSEVTTAPVAAAVSEQSFGTAPEIIAAITAAVSACLEVSSDQFKILAVQPAPSGHNSSTSNWAVMGRKRLMEKRQDIGMFRRERR
ncbi:MAG: OadG family protein [Bacillota bacterium]|nr:OadG family protein [Bacillota bacterium]MDW7684624.1 OadG family protein [Bacillota bacterium]